jgi:hypothetical protein
MDKIASDASVNFLPTLLQIYRTEGVTGLFRGAGARVRINHHILI